jgi:hypothetical protein
MRTRALLRGLRFNTDSRPPSISCLLTRNHKSVCLRSRRDLRVTPPVGAICTFGLPFPISSSTEGQPPRNARSSSSVHEPHRKFFSNFKEAGEVLDDSVRHFLLDVMATLDGLVRDDVRGIASPYVQELLGARGAGSSRCSIFVPGVPDFEMAQHHAWINRHRAHRDTGTFHGMARLRQHRTRQQAGCVLAL